MMVVPDRASHWDYFHMLGSFEDKHKFNYAVKLYILFIDEASQEDTRQYILSRVIGALGALSNSMRAGAYSLLCTLLVNCPHYCDYETLKKIIDSQLKPTGTMKADAEAYVGQFLAFKAIVQSKLLDNSPAKFKDIVDGLMELALKKSYLYASSLSLIEQISVKTGEEFGSDAFLKSLKELHTGTLDKLHYLLKLEQRFDDSETISHVFDGRRLLSAETATEIGILLSKCYNTSHEFISQLFEAIADNPKYLSKFWKAYENQLKGKIGTNKSSLDMYFVVLSQALKKMLAKKNYKSVKKLVTDVTVESLLKHGKSRPDITKETSRSIAEILTLANNSSMTLEILNKLVFSPGNFSFDEETGTKLVSSLLQTLAKEEILIFGDKCLAAVITGEGLKNKDRLNALNIYCSLLNKPACQTEDEWRVEGMKALLKAGLVTNDNVSSELAVVIRKSFFNVLSMKFPSLPNYANALGELVKCLNHCISKGGSLRVKVTDEMKEAWKLSQKLTPSLEKQKKRSSANNKIILQALELLTCFITLKSLNEPKESLFNLTDINSVFQRITKSDEETDDGPEWIEVVIDLFLNMLSKPNVSNRTIINIVFKTVVVHLNDGAFSQMINVLDPSYDLNKAGEEDNEGESNEDEEDSDESEDSTDDDDDQENEDSKEESEEDDDMEDMEEEEEEMSARAFNQEKLQFDLRKVLMPANESDNESVNVEDIDEEQGEQLDATLAAIFKNAMTKKKPSKRESNTSHFRTRVLDLLESYCITGMPLDHWLVLIPAILKLANSSVAAKNTAGLKNRLLSFIRKVTSLRISDIASDNCDSLPLVDLLKRLMNQAAEAVGTAKDLKQHYLEIIKFCVKNSNHVHPDNIKTLKGPLTTAITEAVGKFFLEKSSLQFELLIFLCQYNWCGVHDVVSQVIELTFANETRPFKRIQGISMLVAYFKSDRLFMNPEDFDAVKKIQNSILAGITSLSSARLLDQKSQQSLAELVVAMHDSKSSGSIKWKLWKEKLPQLLPSPHGNKLHKHFESMCKRLGLNKDSFVGSGDASPSKTESYKGKQEAIKNRKRKHDARKLKKESKIRRMTAFEGVNFSWGNMESEE